MRLLKLIARGARAIVPTSITDTEERSSSSGCVRNNMAYASGTSATVIPNRTATVNRGKYTAPPKATPFAVIPSGVCRNC